MMRQSVAVGEGLEGNNGWNPFLASAAVGGSGQWIKAAGEKKKQRELLPLLNLQTTNVGWQGLVQSVPLPSIFPLFGCQALLF